MKTYMATPSTIERKWYVVDAADKTLGRLAAEVAKVLRGKNKPTFTPHMDTGDHVIIINAEKIKLTGKKLVHKIYFRHSGYLGGATYTKAGELLKKDPVRMVEMAVRGMVPRNRLGSQIFTKLHVYAGPEHPHAAQKPEVLTIDIR
ncbi:MAG: 50S ribosomal protein L13 [Acidaminococcaceae bacterium]|jgi:large subunit ribosomal protein L13|nr:50S ribosomal protein L13 [Acidaminococcaceae bacterium]MCI2109423.1 50S ribosomal protein L13 [Acidaminococcaceae bacterium]